LPTAKQTAANRRNAKRSTGPRTEAGKAIASRNSFIHGLFYKHTAVLPWEQEVLFDIIADELWDDLAPQGFMERLQFEQILLAVWKLRRINSIEAGVFIGDNRVIGREHAEEAGRPLLSQWNLPYDSPCEQLPAKEKEWLRLQLDLKYFVYRPNLIDEALAFVNDIKGADALAKLRRYQTAFENSYYRALHELQHLQAIRRELADSRISLSGENPRKRPLKNVA